MKKLILPVLGLAAMLGLHSCSEDFEVAAPYKDITVAYGVLNISDTAHYIRIQKAFLDEQKSAIDMARVADSSFYTQLDVKVREVNNNNVVSTTALDRVDLTNEGYPKEPGAFFTAPNYAYKFKKALNPNYTYRLVITNPQTGQVDSAQVAVINNDKNVFTVSQFNLVGYAISFVSSGLSTFTWNVKTPPNSAYYEGVIRFRWVDKNVLTNTQTDHYADWTWSSIPSQGGAAVKMETSYSNFFSFLSSAIGPAPANVERYMDSCDLYVWAADTTMYNYMQYANAQGGITADEIKPTYTNFHSNKTTKSTLGILSSRAYHAEYNVPINDASINALRNNTVTEALQVRGRSDH